MTYILLVKTYRISWRKKEAISLLKSIINRSELMDIHAILDRTITHTHTHTHTYTHTTHFFMHTKYIYTLMHSYS